MKIPPIFHNCKDHIRISSNTYPNSSVEELSGSCGKLPYSRTYGSWYIPYEIGILTQLKKTFVTIQVLDNNAPTRTEQIVHQTDIASIHEYEPPQCLRTDITELGLHGIKKFIIAK